MKNRLVVGLTVATIVLAIITFSCCSIAYRNKVARDKEMMARLALEERMSQLTSRGEAGSSGLEKARSALEAERQAHQATKQALVEEQISSQALREEVERITSQIRVLEEKLQEALSIQQAIQP
ncbi:MAG: hypothetical protein MJA29_00055 [Candidatus Omnitrophica bacterium]|nr:hypothetical protein [Candidatus Omnitrophota bacterium]